MVKGNPYKYKNSIGFRLEIGQSEIPYMKSINNEWHFKIKYY